MKSKKNIKNLNNDNNSMVLLNKEEAIEESESFYIDLQKIKYDNAKNNSKDKKKKDENENENNNLVKGNNNTISYNVYLKKNEKINLIKKEKKNM